MDSDSKTVLEKRLMENFKNNVANNIHVYCNRSCLKGSGLDMDFAYRNHIFCLFPTLGCNTITFIPQYGCEINSQFTSLGKVVNIDSTTAKQMIH